MKRSENVSKIIESGKVFDFVVIGGGATGIGIALEAATRGYSVALFEKSDFTKGTSSKSTKLVHGGVRYLAQGDIALVREASVERGLLVKNAPHLVSNQSFIIPTFGLWDELMYTVGLTFYDLLAGRFSLGRSLHISKTKTLLRLPAIKAKGLTAGVLYHDGQFDDSRLAINALQTACEYGALPVNYFGVEHLIKDENGNINGVVAKDELSGTSYTIKAKAVINATGVFVDDILHMDNPELHRSIKPSQGIHLVLDKSFFPGNDALMIPKTDDGRVLFAVPWHNHVVVGTTDTPIESTSLEPVALDDEVNFILKTMGRYLTRQPSRTDVLSVFAGLRPLAAPKGDSTKTKEISRSHKIFVSPSNLFTMVGGKWTTFRRMAQDMVEKVEKTLQWAPTQTATRQLHLHGYVKKVDRTKRFYWYGSDIDGINQIIAEKPELGEYISESLGLIKAQVVWAVRNEMAITVEDVLSRRTRCLLLNAREAITLANEVAKLMAIELGKDDLWQKQQVDDFNRVASKYILR